jgi:hypothetical protein
VSDDEDNDDDDDDDDDDDGVGDDGYQEGRRSGGGVGICKATLASPGSQNTATLRRTGGAPDLD